VITPLEIEMAAEAGTPRAVRREFARRFSGHPCLDELLLCLSEVVTNAVLHASTPITVTATGVRGDSVRVEVTDRSTVLPVHRRFEGVSPTGRGLHLLDRLTTAWGVEVLPHGKTVWFEIGPSAR